MKHKNDLPQDHEIAAIIPIYDKSGGAVVVHTADGRAIIYANRVKTILRNLAERQGKTLPLLRRNVCLAGAREIAVPIPISLSLVLVPCKVRRPRIDGDESLGYINAALPCTIERRDKETVVKLVGGQEVHSLWGYQTMRQKMERGRLIVLDAIVRARRTAEEVARAVTGE